MHVNNSRRCGRCIRLLTNRLREVLSGTPVQQETMGVGGGRG